MHAKLINVCMLKKLFSYLFGK